MTDPLPPSLAANPRLDGWLDFSAGGLVTVRPGKVEYGQGVWTALAQIAAEELDVRLDQVRIAPVSTATSPDEGVTSGSRSIEDSGGALHWVCAQARAALLAAAAARLEIDPATLSVRGGEVRTAAGGTGLSYWSWSPGLPGRAAAPGAPAKPPARWSVAGRSVPRIDLPDKVTGRPRFLHDLVLPGMLFGRVVRPPAPWTPRWWRSGTWGTRPAWLAQVRRRGFPRVIAETDRAAVAAARRLARARPVDGARLAARRAGPEGLPAGGARAGAARGAAPRPGRRGPGHPARWPPSSAGRSSRTRRWPRAARSPGGTGTPSPCGRTARASSRCAGRWPPGSASTRRGSPCTTWRGPGCTGTTPRTTRPPTRCCWPGRCPAARSGCCGPARTRLGWGPVGPAMLARLSAGLDAAGRIQAWRQDVWSNGFIGRPGTGGEPRLLALSHLAGGRADPARAGRAAVRRDGRHPQRGARLRHPRSRGDPAPAAGHADPDLVAALAGRVPQRVRDRVVHG